MYNAKELNKDRYLYKSFTIFWYHCDSFLLHTLYANMFKSKTLFTK